ncbi:MAG TPA: hypothetical protein VFH39_00390, partial [Candidatus Saccharimonadales bacterium]|nr:hypothetical protein [Candidatus Saccharimonadales bacterium]
MNSLFGRSSPLAVLKKLLGTGLLVLLVGIAVNGSAQATVSVDQQPLTIQKPLPPNIVLMLDDSGSMAWDFMPDAGYLSGKFTAYDENGYRDTFVGADALRSNSVNGLYYNPGTTYKPPVYANGTSYPTPSGLASAYANPFLSTASTDTVDVTTYRSPWLCDYTGYDTTQSGGNYPCPNSLYNAFPYFTAFPSGGASQPSLSCPYGGAVSSNGFCNSSQYGYYVATVSCSGGKTYRAATGWCESSSTSYIYLFTYTKPGTTAGSYVRYYVGKSATDCAAAPSSSTCVYDTATQKNVATWFSYYRRRILMAKSGVMSAFSGIDATFRVGFGSIDGGDSGNKNYLNLPTSQYQYADAYNGGNNYIAQVQAFGDGSAGTQKSSLWTWIAAAKASGGTPLRQALDAAGTYYGTDQPWQSKNASTNATEELACRQSYTILTTDGFWNGKDLGNGNIDNTAATLTGANQQTYTYTP